MTGQAHLFVLLCVFVLGAAFQTQTGWLYLTGASGLGVLALSWVTAWAQLRHVRLESPMVTPVHQGSAARFELGVLRDRGTARGLQLLLPPKKPRFWFGWWRGALVPDHWPVTAVPEAGPGRPGRAGFALDTSRRGEFELPWVIVQSAYPLGLVALTRRVRPAGRYLVYPVGPRLVDLPWLAPRGDAHGAQRLQDSRQGLLIRGVREYRPGDAWREIHWRTTARLGQPHVRESEQDQGEALVLFLDLRAHAHSEATVDHLVTVAASLVAHALESGRPVRLATHPDAEPDSTAPAGYEAWAWLARARAVAPDVAPTGPEGAVLLSPVYVPGWQAWASHFVYCPGGAANAMDATVYCPVGAPIAEALGQERRA